MSHLSTTAASHHYSSEVLLSDVENRNVMDTMGINQTIGGKSQNVVFKYDSADPHKYRIPLSQTTLSPVSINVM